MTLDDVVTMLLAVAIERVYAATAWRADAADDEIQVLYASWRTAYDARRSATTRALRAGWVYRWIEPAHTRKAVRRAVRLMQKAHDALRAAQLTRLAFTEHNVPGEADPVRVTMRLRTLTPAPRAPTRRARRPRA